VEARLAVEEALEPSPEPIEVRLHPICVTHWNDAGEPYSVEPGDSDQLGRLDATLGDGRTVLIETALDDLNPAADEWLKGEFDPWKAMPAPPVDWSAVAPILTAVGTAAPPQQRQAGESLLVGLLRTLPYAYSRGAFGTVRDSFWSVDALPELAIGDDHALLTVFPTAGFLPSARQPDRQGLRFTVLHGTVGAAGRLAVVVRLPDTFCPRHSDAGDFPRLDRLVPPGVLTRFLPRQRMPSGREVAEAIGMHQATSARCVANRIREELEGADLLAAGFQAEDEGEDDGDGPPTEEEVILAAATVDRLAEVGHQLDRHLSTVLRRFGGELPDAPPAARELVPPEVKRRYRFALDNVHLLHEDCRLVAQAIRNALATHDREQREQFQFVAALLASIVLIPTLLAGIFGASLAVPAEENESGFWVFLLVLVVLAATASSALRKARQQNWQVAPSELRAHGLIALGTLVAFFIFLAVA
jgi:hypothetical protein